MRPHLIIAIVALTISSVPAVTQESVSARIQAACGHLPANELLEIRWSSDLAKFEQELADCGLIYEEQPKKAAISPGAVAGPFMQMAQQRPRQAQPRCRPGYVFVAPRTCRPVHRTAPPRVVVVPTPRPRPYAQVQPYPSSPQVRVGSAYSQNGQQYGQRGGQVRSAPRHQQVRGEGYCADPSTPEGMKTFLRTNGPQPRPNCTIGPIPNMPCGGWVCTRSHQ